MTRRASDARVCSPPDMADGGFAHSSLAKPRPLQGGVDALVERVPAEDIELMLEIGVRGIGHAAIALEGSERVRHPLEVRGAGPNGRPQVRGGHEGLVEVGLLPEQPDSQAALPDDLATIRLIAARRKSQQRGLAGAVRTDQADPVAERDRRLDRIEDDERPDLTGHLRQPQDRHQPLPVDATRAAARRVAAARFVRSVRSDQRGPRRRVPPGHVPQDRPGASPVTGGKPLTPRAEVRTAGSDHDPFQRSTAAAARLARPLVDREAFLHLAVAVGRRVVVDGASSALDRLGQDRSDRLVQVSFIGRSKRRGRPQRVEARHPERLVRVDVARPRPGRTGRGAAA